MHQYAYTGKGKSIHSSAQLEWFKQNVHDKSVKVGGQQCITTNDGYVIPLNIKSGLPYMPMRPYTDSEWDTLPHVILTADSDWDPTVLDNDLADDDEWFDAVSDMPEDPVNTPFDQFGDYRHTHIVTEAFLSNSILDNSLIMDLPTLYQAHEH